MEIGKNIKSDIGSADEVISDYVYEEQRQNIKHELRCEIKSFMWEVLEDMHLQLISQISRSTYRKIEHYHKISNHGKNN